MLIDEIKKANVQSIREQDTTARAIFSIVLNKHLIATIEKRATKQEMKDEDTIAILQKTIKELTEEEANYRKMNNVDSAVEIARQKLTLEQYLPAMLSSEEIDAIIDALPDKSIPTIMKHFKEHYAGKVDMSMVNIKAKSVN